MLSKKEVEDMEMAKKGAEIIEEELDKISKFEKRIVELDKISELEKKIVELEIIVKMHKDNFETIKDALESNLGIMKDIQDRFRRHINNLSAHKE